MPGVRIGRGVMRIIVVVIIVVVIVIYFLEAPRRGMIRAAVGRVAGQNGPIWGSCHDWVHRWVIWAPGFQGVGRLAILA